MIGDLIVMAACVWAGYYLGSTKDVPQDTTDSVKKFFTDLQQ